MELTKVERVGVGWHNDERGAVRQGLINLWCLPVAVILVLAYWVWLHRFLQRKYMGPKTWPILGCIVEQARNFDVIHDWLLSYFRRGILTYPVPMVFVNNIFTADPRNVEYILKSNFSNYPKGELLQERFFDLVGLGIFNVDGDMWLHQRKMITLEFSSAKLRDYTIHVYRKEAIKLLQHLTTASKRPEPVVNIQDFFMRLTLDSICKVGFGVEVGCLSPTLPTLPFANAFDEAHRLIVRRYIDMFWKIKRFLNIGAEKEFKRHLKVINDFIYNVINTRRNELQASPYKARSDILSRFMTITPGEEAYSDERLRDVMINLIAAGRDTTALTLSWFFYELCKNPHVVEKIVAELETVVGGNLVDGRPEDHAANPGNTKATGHDMSSVAEFASRLTYASLSRLHYLHGALTEALRFYPPVPLETKVAASADVFPDGHRVKGGVFVSYSSYAMGRLEALWGPDVMEFKPERWLQNGVFQPQSPFKLTAFQAGPRICLGKDSAYMQMKLTTAILLRFLRFSLLPKEPTPKYSVMVVLYICNGLRLGVTQKDSKLGA